MSIIIGIVTKTCALVASDGRMFSGAYFENGKRIKNSTVKRDDFDKTFVLDSGNLIGAVAGIMSFNGKKISEHIKELIVSKNPSNNKLLDVISIGLKEKLENISPDEIGFHFRKLDLILINTTSGLLNDLKIKAMKFYPNSDNTAIEFGYEEIFPEIKGNVSWKLFGDDSSQNAINGFLYKEIKKMMSVNEKTLRSLLYKTIRQGIMKSEENKDGNDLNCGGKVFVKSIKNTPNKLYIK